jgi:hypothetical protein
MDLLTPASTDQSTLLLTIHYFHNGLRGTPKTGVLTLNRFTQRTVSLAVASRAQRRQKGGAIHGTIDKQNTGTASDNKIGVMEAPSEPR